LWESSNPQAAVKASSAAHPAGYASTVCSGAQSAISEIAEAIDQLAADSRARSASSDMTARVAAVWAMVAALDPEVDRLRMGYENG